MEKKYKIYQGCTVGGSLESPTVPYRLYWAGNDYWEDDDAVCDPGITYDSFEHAAEDMVQILEKNRSVNRLYIEESWVRAV